MPWRRLCRKLLQGPNWDSIMDWLEADAEWADVKIAGRLQQGHLCQSIVIL